MCNESISYCTVSFLMKHFYYTTCLVLLLTWPCMGKLKQTTNELHDAYWVLSGTGLLWIWLAERLQWGLLSISVSLPAWQGEAVMVQSRDNYDDWLQLIVQTWHGRGMHSNQISLGNWADLGKSNPHSRYMAMVYGTAMLVAMFHHFAVGNESLMTRLAVTLVNN